ncbi:MAG: VOC family protein [Acidobacteria bacterium]|nr:VOC family protein [Acidobacteriota bacterium]
MDLNQLTLPAADLERSVEFYRTLGLRLIVDSVPRYARLECPDGGSTLSLHHLPDAQPAEGLTIYFECADLDSRVEELKAVGIRFESDPEDQRWLWREARLRDPDGHELCLFWAGDARRHPPWRVEDRRRLPAGRAAGEPSDSTTGC